MKCFIIAMEKEAAPIIAEMKVNSDKTVNDRRIVGGELFGESVYAVVCGVGKVNAACGTQYAVDVLGADLIINVGVAGALNNSLCIGELCEISHAVQYDFDLTQLNGTPIGTLDEYKENYLPLDCVKKYPLKRLATGDRFNDSSEDYALLTRTLSADVRDMEGAAIVQTCMHANVKCRSYKIISDISGSGSTTEQYLENLSLCFETLKKELKNIG